LHQDIDMRYSRQVVRLAVALSVSLAVAGVCGAAEKAEVIRAPDRGIQPQVLIDSRNVLHMLYYLGKEGEGDLFYVRREPGKSGFSRPVRVNSQPGSAVAIGTIRGGQMALGKNHRVHVMWNGSLKAMPKGPNNSTPLLYARLKDDGKSFEPQRNLMRQTFGLDGGGAVAADRDGNVYVAWHGLQVGSANGEENRKVWVAVSSDEGKTFARERQANADLTGTCGCCGMRGFVDSKGALHLLYRSAGEKVNRDMHLLTSTDHGKTFESKLLQRWKKNECVMSLAAFAEGEGGVRAAWETEGQVYFATIEPGTAKVSEPIGMPGAGRAQKYPAVAVGPKGETVLAWAEGAGWNKGGALVWQAFDSTGKPAGERGRVDGGIPVWGLPAVAVDSNGKIVVVH
jgi:hypothetical protein